MYQKAVEGADGYAQCRLDVVYQNGDLGVAINFEAALTSFHKAVGGGETIAQH